MKEFIFYECQKRLHQLFNTLLEEVKQIQSSKPKHKVNVAQKENVKEYNYYLRDSVLTKKEQDFYEVLLQIANPDRFSILSQVSLIEIFQPTRDNYLGSKGKIQYLHLDFLLCRKTLIPIKTFVIPTEDRQSRDAWRNQPGQTEEVIFPW